MDEKRYVLSQYVQVSDANELLPPDRAAGDPEVEQIRRRIEGTFALFDDRRSDIYLVNPVIKAFLSLLEVPRTRLELVTQLAAIAHCEPEQIADVADTFLRKMVRRRIVFEEGTEQLEQEDALLEIGAVLGTYRVEDVLSVRSGSDIYLAHPVARPGHHVVLKVFKVDPNLDERAIAKRKAEFSREFELMFALETHENVCQVLDFVAGEPPHAVLEYVDGERVYQVYKRTGYDLAYRLDVAGQVLRSIAHLHRHHLLHGDIHDCNFVLTSGGCVKVIDFGMAFREEMDADQVVVHGGVPYFIPPERVTAEAFRVSKHEGDARAEVHQLGVVLYGLLSGRLPFRGFLWRDLVHAIQEEVPAPLLATPEGEEIPSRYRSIIERSLKKDPRTRYRSAVEMSQAWERAHQAGTRSDGRSRHGVTPERVGQLKTEGV